MHQYLLSYRFVEADLELIMIGPHKNYYRDVKSYLKGKTTQVGTERQKHGEEL